VAILIVIAVLIAVAAIALASRARRATSDTSEGHADWMRHVTKAATGLEDLPRL